MMNTGKSDSDSAYLYPELIIETGNVIISPSKDQLP